MIISGKKKKNIKEYFFLFKGEEQSSINRPLIWPRSHKSYKIKVVELFIYGLQN